MYNDFVVKNLIDAVKQENEYSYLMYLSDHGEDVYDGQPTFSHQEASATTYMFEIPFIVWCSDKYKKYNKDKYLEALNNVDKPFQTDDLIHAVLINTIQHEVFLIEILNIRKE